MLPGEVDAGLFAAQMAMLADHFNVMPLMEAVTRLRDDALPRRAVAITFDDGYADNAEVALPILRRYGLKATFFVAAGYLDGGCMWNDRVLEALRAMPGESLEFSDPAGETVYSLRSWEDRRLAAKRLVGRLKYLDETERERRIGALLRRAAIHSPSGLMMRSAQVRTLHEAGMEIGGHTMNHPILSRVDDARAGEEIAAGKARLESLIGAPLRAFAYPNGRPDTDYAARHVRMVREAGFSCAVSTAWGTAHRGSDIYQLPRFTPWDREVSRFMMRMMQNYLRRREQRAA